jgi:hypothetical protein
MKNIMIVLTVCVLSLFSLSAYSQQIVVYNNYGYGSVASTASVQYYSSYNWSAYNTMPQPYPVYYSTVPISVHHHYNTVPVTISWQPAIVYPWNYNVYHRKGCFGNYYYYYYR